jgi:hypothetical protein
VFFPTPDKVTKMSKRNLVSVFAAFAAIATIGYAAGTVSLKDVKCIMAGEKDAKEDKSAEWKDGKVFFCCDGCKGTFAKATKEEKEKIAPKANYQLVATKQYEQHACPMSGEKVDASKALEVGGTKVAFCCKNCLGAAEKMKPEERVEKLFSEEAFKKAKYELVKEKK